MVVENVGDNGNDDEIYAVVTIVKWYAHSFNQLYIDKMSLVLKHMLVNCNSNMCSEVKKFVITEMIENEILVTNQLPRRCFFYVHVFIVSEMYMYDHGPKRWKF